MTNDRLQQILEYAQALEQLALDGRGNVTDTRDIVKALQELQAYHEFGSELSAMPPQPKHRMNARKPQPRKAA